MQRQFYMDHILSLFMHISLRETLKRSLRSCFQLVWQNFFIEFKTFFYNQKPYRLEICRCSMTFLSRFSFWNFWIWKLEVENHEKIQSILIPGTPFAYKFTVAKFLNSSFSRLKKSQRCDLKKRRTQLMSVNQVTLKWQWMLSPWWTRDALFLNKTRKWKSFCKWPYFVQN